MKNFLGPENQQWVRFIEGGISDLKGLVSDINESDRSQGITIRAMTDTVGTLVEQQELLQVQQNLLVEQQSALQAAQNTLSALTTRVSEQTTGGSFDSNVNANVNAMGTQHIVEGPEWASRALVVASASKNTNPSNGWDGAIELVTMNRSIVYGDVGNYEATMMIGIDNASFVPQSNPLVVTLTNGPQVYLRPIGIYMGSGTRGVNYNLSFSYSITWI